MYSEDNYTYYSTLQDIFVDCDLSADTIIAGINSAPDFVNYISAYIPDGIEDKDKLIELFRKHIIPRCWDSVVDITTDDDTIYTHDEFFGNLAEWIVSSEDKYLPILAAWDDNKKNLMQQLETTMSSVNRSSDTPEVSGDWDGDDQISAIASSSTKTTSTIGSVINQLHDIRKRYRSIMSEWAQDFVNRFTMEVITW